MPFMDSITLFFLQAGTDCAVCRVGDLEGAASMYARAVAAEPDNVATLYNYAAMQEECIGDFESSKRLLEQALRVEPTNSEVLAAYSRVYLAAAKTNERQAVEDVSLIYKSALQLRPVDTGEAIESSDCTEHWMPTPLGQAEA
jgi:tetratricopeptide (TPR) repeat protein